MTGPERDLRLKLTADLSQYIEHLGGDQRRRYIPHAIIRALLARAGVRYDWQVDATPLDSGDWVARGTLTVHWPTITDGRTNWWSQSYTEIGEPAPDPASASSRLFVRAVAFTTMLGIEAWEPRARTLAAPPQGDDVAPHGPRDRRPEQDTPNAR